MAGIDVENTEDTMSYSEAGRDAVHHQGIHIILIIVVVIAQLVAGSAAFAVGPDKYGHFGGGVAAGLAVDTVMYHFNTTMGPAQRIPTSTALSLIPGFIIEVIDEFSPHNSFGWDDLLADGLGGLTGVLAAELINGQLWISASGKQIRLIGHW